MKTVPNQKIVQIEKEKCNRDNLYAQTNLEALKIAMNELKGEAFKLWMYFSKNQNDYQFALSYKDCKDWGIKKDAYYAAVEKLIELHYLTPRWFGSSIYAFSEIAKESAPEDDTFSENPKLTSEKQKTPSVKTNEPSEKTQRNNTDITKIVQDKTKTSKFDKLKDDIDETGYIESKGKWIDKYYWGYNYMSKDEKINCWLKLGYSLEESRFIVEEIMGE